MWYGRRKQSSLVFIYAIESWRLLKMPYNLRPWFKLLTSQMKVQLCSPPGFRVKLHIFLGVSETSHIPWCQWSFTCPLLSEGNFKHTLLLKWNFTHNLVPVSFHASFSLRVKFVVEFRLKSETSRIPLYQNKNSCIPRSQREISFSSREKLQAFFGLRVKLHVFFDPRMKLCTSCTRWHHNKISRTPWSQKETSRILYLKVKIHVPLVDRVCTLWSQWNFKHTSVSKWNFNYFFQG